jgi:hypothetical protein
VHRFVDGEKLRILSKEYGVSGAAISVRAKDMGYVVGGKGRAHKGKKLSPEQLLELSQRAQSERGCDLAKEFGVSRALVTFRKNHPYGDPNQMKADSSFITPGHGKTVPIPEPHAIAGVTRAMLMAGRVR